MHFLQLSLHFLFTFINKHSVHVSTKYEKYNTSVATPAVFCFLEPRILVLYHNENLTVTKLFVDYSS